MAKVGLKLGFTFRVGPLDTNQYARMDMEILNNFYQKEKHLIKSLVNKLAIPMIFGIQY
jgi:hypothetical protein